jgi:hypothetical protein
VNSGTCNAGTYRGVCNGGSGTTNTCIGCSNPGTCAAGTYRGQCSGGSTENPCVSCATTSCAENQHVSLCTNSASNSCVNCNRNIACDDGNYLSQCSQTSNTDTGTCTICGVEICSGNTRIKDCTGGQTKNTCAACDTTQDCGATKYRSVCDGSSESDSSCVNCDTNVVCGAGTYKSVCTGNGATTSSCESCPSNSNSPSNSDHILFCSCNNGYIGSNGGSCVACAQGTYKTASLECTSCVAGKEYSGTAGQSESVCQDCTAGKFAALRGTALCTECEPGKYQHEEGQMSCRNSQVGTYQPLSQQESCNICPAGKFRSSENGISISDCQDCGPDQLSGEGASACENCDSDASSAPASSECIRCPPGFFWDNTGFLCSECPFETYKVESGSSDCLPCRGASVFKDSVTPCTQLTEPCATGHYYEGTVCTKCLQNHTTLPNPDNVILYSDACVCTTGHAKNIDRLCLPCSVGSYAPVLNTTCIKSSAGTFVSTTGSTFARQCPRDWVAPSSAADSCVPCLWGTTANIGNTVCVPGMYTTPILPQQFAYQVQIFCVDPLSAGTMSPAGNEISKMSSSTWNGVQAVVQLYPNFKTESELFQHGVMCEHAFLHSKPVACLGNSFAMRVHSYIWECVSCPIGKYKATTGTAYSECLMCTGISCASTKNYCDDSSNILLQPPARNAVQYFENIQVYS